jgi:nucleotide-binding universal stress UspA family protein
MWTYPPHRILVAVDFGDASTRALRVAGDLSRTFNAQLRALHAETFDAPPYFTSEQVRSIERQRRAARGEATRYLAAFAQQHAGVVAEPLISDAPPADAILQAARDSDLIVMGTHGRRGPARWWAGSVAERVAREATVPVLVVRATGTPAQPFKRITVIAGGGTFDGPARRYAKGLAATFDGESSRETASSVGAATLQDATLVIVAQAHRGGPLAFSGTAEQALRSCRRPILFVPPV